MRSDFSPSTDGSGFAADALPFQDLQPQQAPQFERVNGEVKLIGSVSRGSGSLAFPQREVCMETGARDMAPMYFGPYGTLYSFSTVRVSAKREVPYILGYVDFDNGVRVLAHVRADDVAALYCDMPVCVQAEGEAWFVVPVVNAEIVA